MRLGRLLPVLLPLLLCVPSAARAVPLELVDPFIGTVGEGNVYPGVSVPFGFIQVSPDTGPGSGAAGYKRNKDINAFSQQHISGMGGPLYGQLSVFPLTGELRSPSTLSSTGKSAEAASPGYYTVTLAPWDVKVELSATQHVALHRHTFPASEEARVLVAAGHVLYGHETANWNSGKPVGGALTIDPAAREVSGRITYQGGRANTRTYTIHFVVRFDTPFASHDTWTDGDVLSPGSAQTSGNEIGASLNFRTGAGQVVQSRVALSYRSLDQARAYLAAQAPTWDFDATVAATRSLWADTLSTLAVEGGTPAERRMLATALYRVHLTPNDWTGEAPDRYGDGIYFENILCLWDTFRTTYPLLTLIQPEVQTRIVNTLLRYHQIDGWTGDAHSAWTYEHVQNGSSADVVIADAYVKKLPGIDWPAAYAAIRKNAFVDPNPAQVGRPNLGRFRTDDYRRFHYVPSDVSESRSTQGVSRTLEYAHNDFSVLTLARDFGTPADIAALEQSSLWYKNLWDAEAGGFMRGKNKDGFWHSPFDPLKTETGRHYYEGHAWTWSWYVPHDPQGLIDLHGGPAAFIEKLTVACDQYYQAWNEPSMLQTYLFIHAGRPDLTQRFVRQALTHFNDGPKGLPGNDDSGTTSAWLAWSLLGLYPNAGQDFYYIGSPAFTRATVSLPAGKKLVIRAPAASPENKYIASATLNGRPWPRAWLRHADFIDGAELVLEMVPTPTAWGATELPPSFTPTR
jgi:predicted alpha-1,2-mannosidase